MNGAVLPTLPIIEFDYDLIPIVNPPAHTFPYTMPMRRPNGLPFMHGRPDNAKLSWWQCVMFEYNSMCSDGELSEVMCAMAGMAAPELVLVVFASWMLSCAW